MRQMTLFGPAYSALAEPDTDGANSPVQVVPLHSNGR
jgi:hypothetical protein